MTSAAGFFFNPDIYTVWPVLATSFFTFRKNPGESTYALASLLKRNSCFIYSLYTVSLPTLQASGQGLKTVVFLTVALNSSHHIQ